MKIYHLKRCDTCRKALKALRAADIEFEAHDVREDGLPTTEIAKIVEAVGWEKALNRRSETWRSLDNPEQSNMDDVRAVSLIASHPLLLKRPAIMDGGTITVGWKDDAQRTWLPQ